MKKSRKKIKARKVDPKVGVRFRRGNYFICLVDTGKYQDWSCKRLKSRGVPCLEICEECLAVPEQYVLGVYSLNYEPGDFVITKKESRDILQEGGILDRVFSMSGKNIITVSGKELLIEECLKYVGAIINPNKVKDTIVIKRRNFKFNRKYRLVSLFSYFYNGPSGAKKREAGN